MSLVLCGLGFRVENQRVTHPGYSKSLRKEPMVIWPVLRFFQKKLRTGLYEALEEAL
jgi:hypothetical protein